MQQTDMTPDEFAAAARRYADELLRLRGQSRQPAMQSAPPPTQRSVPESRQPAPSQSAEPPAQEAVFPAPMPEFPAENSTPAGWNGNSLPQDAVLRAEGATDGGLEPFALPPNPMIRTEADAPELGAGTLTVTVRTADNALPVPDATVVITDERDGNRRLMAQLQTDDAGIAETVELPAPLSPPDVQNVPYAAYTVEVRAAGYQTERSMDVPVLAGVEATLPVLLTPEPADITLPEQVNYNEMPTF